MQKMKPDWDKLMDAFADSKDALVADVDCTTEGKPLCDANGVRGYPTIKWGDPSSLEDYKGGRDYDSLKKFADENLKPICSPSNLDLCDDDKKSEIGKFMEMASDELDKLIAGAESKMEEAEEAFKAGVTELQEKYQKMMTDKDELLEKIKSEGLGLMKSVKAAKAKGADGAKAEL
jgi:Thioredoxin